MAYQDIPFEQTKLAPLKTCCAFGNWSLPYMYRKIRAGEVRIVKRGRNTLAFVEDIIALARREMETLAEIGPRPADPHTWPRLRW